MREFHTSLDTAFRPYSLIANFLHGASLFAYKVIISPECDESELDYTTKCYPSEGAMRDDPDFVEVVDDGEFALGVTGAF